MRLVQNNTRRTYEGYHDLNSQHHAVMFIFAWSNKILGLPHRMGLQGHAGGRGASSAGHPGPFALDVHRPVARHLRCPSAPLDRHRGGVAVASDGRPPCCPPWCACETLHRCVPNPLLVDVPSCSNANPSGLHTRWPHSWVTVSYHCTLKANMVSLSKVR
jgi:hypothetical protein